METLYKKKSVITIGLVAFALIYPLVATYVYGRIMHIYPDVDLTFDRFRESSRGVSRLVGFSFLFAPGLIALCFLPLSRRLVWIPTLGIVYVLVMLPISLIFGFLTGCYLRSC